MRKRNVAATIMITALAFGSANASIISIDFNNTTDAAWTVSGTEAAGPLGSSYWNTTSAASGTGQALVDDSNNGTTATVTWNSGGTWTTGEGSGGGNTDGLVSHAYLDDGTTTNLYGGAVSSLITIENIPYAEYRIYGLLASGDGDNYSSRNFQVNGAYVWGTGRDSQADAYGTTDAAFAGTGSRWTKLEQGVTRGNYWTYETSGSTLVVNGIDKWAGGRASITGVIIEQIPEPATLGLVVAFGGATLFIRRKMDF